MKPENWTPASGARMTWDAMYPESEPPVVGSAIGSANTSDFTRGFVCAIACLLNSHGNGTEVGELVRCAGKTEHVLKHADAEDIKTLRSYGYLPNDPDQRPGESPKTL